MSDTESNGSNSPAVEISDEAMTSQTEFQDRVETARKEIQTKFKEFADQLKEEETSLLEKLDGIENEVLKKFDVSSKSLNEISHARKQVLSTFKSNATNTLLKKNLDMYDREIESIKRKSKIDTSTIQLKWNAIQFDKICELKLLTEKVVPEMINISPVHDEHNIPSVHEKQNIPSVHDKQNIPYAHEKQNIQSVHDKQYIPYVQEKQNILSVPKLTNPISEFAPKGYIDTNYQSINTPFSVSPSPSRDRFSPNMAQSSVKRMKYEGNSRWQCPYCSHLNLVKYTYCENCYKSTEQPDSSPMLAPIRGFVDS